LEFFIVQTNPAKPLLSIVIATRNRIPTAISAIESILSINDARLELVIQDNSDFQDLQSFVHENIKDSRLRYRYDAKPMSMVGNFNASMELATGEYVCLIGDDDGVNPEILDATAWAKSEGLDSLGIRQTAHYLWPGTGLSSTVFSKVVGGNLLVEPFEGKIIEIDLEKELKALLHNGGLYYLKFNLPKAYHGIARRACLETIKEKTGNYFGGASPDIFSSLALACIAKKAAIIEYPLTIPGHCRVAENTHHVKDAHLRPMASCSHFQNRGDYKWCDLVPYVFIGEAFWVDAGVAALKGMGREDLVKELSLPKLAAHCIGSYTGLTKVILKTMFNGLKKTKQNRVKGVMQFIWGLITGPGLKFSRRAWNRIMLIIGVRVNHQFFEIKDMSECTQELSRYLEKNGYSFNNCIINKDK
jgi:hypothetical protein